MCSVNNLVNQDRLETVGLFYAIKVGFHIGFTVLDWIHPHPAALDP